MQSRYNLDIYMYRYKFIFFTDIVPGYTHSALKSQVSSQDGHSN